MDPSKTICFIHVNIWLHEWSSAIRYQVVCGGFKYRLKHIFAWNVVILQITSNVFCSIYIRYCIYSDRNDASAYVSVCSSREAQQANHIEVRDPLPQIERRARQSTGYDNQFCSICRFDMVRWSWGIENVNKKTICCSWNFLRNHKIISITWRAKPKKYE